MKAFIANIGLAVAWALITDDFSTHNVVIGLVMGYVLFLLLAPAMGEGATGYVRRVGRIAAFIAFFAREMVKANLRMVYHVLTPHSSMSPGVVGVPLEPASDLEITLLANLVTLTPGTLSVDVSGDRRTLYVHAVDCVDPEAVRKEIKDGFEARLLELTR
ncbi:MAG: Na+/H+ antiporter subunit E [Phycisphaerales bacterium]